MAGRAPEPTARFVDAGELARSSASTAAWVYAHANALHAIRLGGPAGGCASTWRPSCGRSTRRPDGRGAEPAPRGAKLMQMWGELLPIDP